MDDSEDYYKTLLEDAEKLLQEANELIIARDNVIENLMYLLKQAQEDIEQLEEYVMEDGIGEVEH